MPFNRHRNIAGDTAVQLLPVIFAIVFVAAIAIPDRDAFQLAKKRAKACGDIRAISSALSSYLTVSGTWPHSDSYMYTEGIPAIGEEPWGSFGKAESLAEAFSKGNPRAADVARSQLKTVRSDPWGRRYVILIWPQRRPGLPDGWVISAGQNGIIETVPASAATVGDDIGIPLR